MWFLYRQGFQTKIFERRVTPLIRNICFRPGSGNDFESIVGPGASLFDGDPTGLEFVWQLAANAAPQPAEPARAALGVEQHLGAQHAAVRSWCGRPQRHRLRDWRHFFFAGQRPHRRIDLQGCAPPRVGPDHGSFDCGDECALFDGQSGDYDYPGGRVHTQGN